MEIDVGAEIMNLSPEEIMNRARLLENEVRVSLR